MMALTREFVLIIREEIPKSEPCWEIFLILLRICSISVVPSCTHDLMAYLQVCVEEYLRLFHELYSNKTVIPKQHYMLHYASQMEKSGPLIHSWTMWQESKLRFVKRVSRSSNYKMWQKLQLNVTNFGSVTKCNQILICLFLNLK